MSYASSGTGSSVLSFSGAALGLFHVGVRFSTICAKEECKCQKHSTTCTKAGTDSPPAQKQARTPVGIRVEGDYRHAQTEVITRPQPQFLISLLKGHVLCQHEHSWEGALGTNVLDLANISVHEQVWISSPFVKSLGLYVGGCAVLHQIIRLHPT